jgi:hypothetical protein
MLMRVKIIQSTSDGGEAVNDWVRVPAKSRHCEHFVRPYAVRFEVEGHDYGWKSMPQCNRRISRPSGGAVLMTTGNLYAGFNCVFQ